MDSFSMAITIPVTSISICLASLWPTTRCPVTSCRWPIRVAVMTTVHWNPTRYRALELGMIHNCWDVMNIRAGCRDMEIFGVNTPCLHWCACAHGVRVGLWCTPRRRHSSPGMIQLTNETWWLGKDEWWPPDPFPARLSLDACHLQTWPRREARARCYRACGSPIPDPGLGRRSGHCGARGGSKPILGEAGNPRGSWLSLHACLKPVLRCTRAPWYRQWCLLMHTKWECKKYNITMYKLHIVEDSKCRENYRNTW
jgi:hypothetical protein